MAINSPKIKFHIQLCHKNIFFISVSCLSYSYICIHIYKHRCISRHVLVCVNLIYFTDC